VIYMAIK